MDNINYKRFINFFKKWEGAALLGIGMLAAGALCLWLSRAISWYLYMLSGPLMAVGAVFFIYGSIGRATEADIRELIPRFAEKIAFPELEELPISRRVPKEYETMEFKGFVLTPGNYLKRAKDASLMSSEYDYAKVAVLKDAYYVKTLRFSFVEKKEECATHDIRFDTITDITVVREKEKLTCGKKEFTAKRCHLIFVYEDGKRLALPAGDDVLTDELAITLKRKLGLK